MLVFPRTVFSFQFSLLPGYGPKMRISFYHLYPIYFARFPNLLFYIEFANPIEFGKEISADQKSIILKLAEHIFGRFWIKYINLIVYLRQQTQSCSFSKDWLEQWSMSHLISCILSSAKWPCLAPSMRMMNQLRKVSSILQQSQVIVRLNGDKRCFVGI